MGKKVLVTAGIILLVILLIGLGDYLYFLNKVYPGVSIGQEAVGLLKAEEIKEALKSRGFEQQEVLFKYPKEVEKYSLETLGIIPDYQCLSDRALQIGREGNINENIVKRLEVLREGKDISLCFIVNEQKIDSILQELSGKIKIEAKDADFDIKGDEISIIPGENGIELDNEKSKECFYHALKELREVKAPIEFSIMCKEVEPELTTETLEETGINQMLVNFHTVFSQNDQNRNQNIKLASGFINLYMMAPGEVFSFNQVVGNATAERGFKEAPIIVGGQFVQGVGGGICQVSSTLYNAALLSNMEIIERTNHGRAVGYLPLGRDATIAYDYLDLKFKNSHSHHILISSRVEDNKLVIRIFGNPVSEQRVEIKTTDVVRIEPEIKTEVNNQLKSGEKKIVQSGSPGYRVTVWRIVYIGEEEVNRERLSRDYYKPSPVIYHVGPQVQAEAPVDNLPGNNESVEDYVEGEEEREYRGEEDREHQESINLEMLHDFVFLR
ncbi:VanW family protein [Candidatus Contubernalis alkaliaceticus]|uniref:VanW family protein n=1 Tax=Candidatus Contubernalis alkaliaceticus TaxID=338645 RepID=UPI001F4C09CA|nr:VanW family protein [Candidatus Contubernalis alkalaceticus]UNC91878.1 VanW family protein [Candidatus Contubernalis alkalaceticus]